MGSSSTSNVVVFTCSYYSSVEETRCQCALDAIRFAASRKQRIVVVDASPDEAVRAAMRDAGAYLVREQTAVGRKGAALREALGLAVEVAGSDPEAWLCWQEAEKCGIDWDAVTAVGEATVVVPTREDAAFRKTYPIEQYHSESYANAYVSLIAKDHGFDSPLDWHFGPFALRLAHADLWLKHQGELWEAQLGPIIHAIRKGLIVRPVDVVFNAPAAMKLEEENSLAFIEKRLMQINYLLPKIKEAWIQDADVN